MAPQQATQLLIKTVPGSLDLRLLISTHRALGIPLLLPFVSCTNLPPLQLIFGPNVEDLAEPVRVSRVGDLADQALLGSSFAVNLALFDSLLIQPLIRYLIRLAKSKRARKASRFTPSRPTLEMTLYFLFFPDNAVKVSQMPSGREEKGDWVIPSEFARIVERIYLDLWRNRHSFIASLVVVGVSISKPLPFGEPTGDALAAAVAEIHSIRPKSVWSTPAGVHLLTALSDAQNASEPELPLINLSALMTSAALPLVDTFCTDFWTSFSTSVGSLADAGTGPAADVEKLLVEAAKRAQRAGDEARRSAGRKERHGSLQAGDSGGGGGARRGEGASDRDDRDSLSDGQVAEPAYSTGCSSPAQPMTPSPRDASFSPSSRSPRRTRSRSRATSVSPTPSTSSASGAARNAVAPSNSSAPLSPSQRRRTRSIDSTSETSPPLSKRPRFSAFAALVRPEEQIISTGHLTAGPAAETPAHLQDLEIEDIDEVANVIGTRQSEFAASQSLPMYLLALQFIPFALSSNARSASPSPFPPPSPSPLPPASLRSRSPSPSPADIRYLPSTSEGQRLLRNLTAGNALSPLSNFLRTNAPLSIAEYAALLKESPIDVSIASVIAHLAQGAFLLDHLRAKRERELDDWVDALQAFSDEWEGKGGRPYTARSDWSDIRRTGALQLGAEGVYRPSAKALFRRHGLTEV